MEISKATRIYVAGCGGMLGEAVYNQFSPVAEIKATDIDVNESWLSFADVREYSEIAKSVRDFDPQTIINLAALTDMEYCERNTDNAWLTNALGAENLALLANELHSTYVYISTAGIFDGRQEFYNDFDDPNPLSFYAKSKYRGEVFTREHANKYFVIRAGWMMGGGPRKDKKFISKVYKQKLQGKIQLKAVDDKAGTPTYTCDFAKGIQRLLESDLYGVYNQVCEGSATRYEVAVEFLRLLSLETKIAVERVSSDYFKADYFAPRPPSERLISLKLKARGVYVMRDWKECLKEDGQVFYADLKARGRK